MEIIPAIDIMDGKCVRLTNGDFDKATIYSSDPLGVAYSFEEAGLKRLHLVDLDGAKEGKVKNWKTLEKIASKTKLSIDFGGGIKSTADVGIVINSGGDFVGIGSVAVKDETSFDQWIQEFGADRFILGADVKEEKISISGWLEDTGIWVYDFIEKYIKKGLSKICCTDIGKDGKLSGPSVELYKNILLKFPQIHFIASGGISSVKDLIDLEMVGCKGAIVGKAIYEKRISLAELKMIQAN